MEGTSARGAVTISIDLELEIDHYSSERQVALDQVRERLIELFKTQRIRVTWAVADPARSAASDPILASGTEHEIAVLGDRTWLGCGAGRARAERELARRFDGARRVGMAVTTLALRHVDQPLELPRLLPPGVTALRGSLDRSEAVLPGRIAAAHPALWQVPQAQVVPSLCGWRLLNGWRLEREIQRTVRRRSLLHFGISAPQLIDVHPATFRQLETLVARLGRLERQGSLAVKTLNMLARERLDQRLSSPARSVLRSAA